MIVVGSGPWAWCERTAALVCRADRVVAADGGANHLARIGVRPEAVVGDLDSLRPGVRAWVGENRIVHRPDQERTDLDKTLEYTVASGEADEITVLAATGGRLDHAVENLGLLGRWAQRGDPPVELLDGSHRISAVAGSRAFSTEAGQGLSLLPLGRCEGVNVEGVRWPLRAEPLALLGRTGVSNRALADRVTVSVARGVLMVFLAHPPGW